MSPPPVIRVGHKGADLIEPGNTRASFDAALQAGVDMIEFDVLPEEAPASGRRLDTGGGRLVIAHDYRDAAGRTPLSLDEALTHFAGPEFTGVELDVDLKLPGYEHRVVDALREHGLVERSLISSQFKDSLAVIRTLEPSLRLGWSVPNLRRDPFRSPLMMPAGFVAVAAAARLLPSRAATAVRAGRCDALMAHWRLVTPRLASKLREAGGELYVWTVDDVDRIRALQTLGVTGVITNDPRLFRALAGPLSHRSQH